MAALGCFLLLLVAAASAIPDPVLFKYSKGLRYQYVEDDQGAPRLMDQWVTLSNLLQAARYSPDLQNAYHLFTRQNPSVSQPMLLNSDQLLRDSNFDPSRRTVFIVHGWTQSASSNINQILVPAFLQAADMNVFAVDWSAGSSIAAGTNGPTNAVLAGQSLARAIDWVVRVGGANVDDFHLVGFSLGAHLVAVAGRNIESGTIPYITALDPGANMEDSGHIFSTDAGVYTEAIHTNAGIMGHGNPLAHSDFYPNGGNNNPGCGAVNFICNHYRSFEFFAETLTTTNGFGAARCNSYLEARLGLCFSLRATRMGGLLPKTGTTGIFHLVTNEQPPWSVDSRK